MISLEYISNDYSGYVDETDISRIESEVNSVLNTANSLTITVVLVEDEFIQRLNRDFRNVDSPTDVLSFNISDEQADIYISPSFIEKHLPDGVSLREEVLRMIIHGILHVLGYEHEGYFTEESTEEMFVMQERILSNVL